MFIKPTSDSPTTISIFSSAATGKNVERKTPTSAKKYRQENAEMFENAKKYRKKFAKLNTRRSADRQEAATI
jgi:hypothetical protein